LAVRAFFSTTPAHRRDTIAEAWDAAGAYQVGSFSERRWAEWNGHFRDDVRRFWRGDEGMFGRFASRIGGSSDLYLDSGKGPECSVNFVTCHDGFTLNDLVSYERKHNEANGEDNRDGSNESYSANYGFEGASGDLAVEATRRRQIKNFLLTLAISRGVPMLLAGDEFRRSQRGNNLATGEPPWLLATRRRHVPSGAVRLLRAWRRSRPWKPDELRRRITLERGASRALSAIHPSKGRFTDKSK
jgi:glycogen operon protein